MKRYFFLLLMFVTSLAWAQSDYSSYLNDALEMLKSGNCESAQKFYNVYKELSGDEKPSVQILIDDCQKGDSKSYAIGDKIIRDGLIYKVAYVEDGGKHGFAVCENGSGKKPENSRIPTWAEYKLIKENNKILKLCGKYWSTRRGFYSNEHFVFGLGGRPSGYYSDSDIFDILLIYRF